MRIITFIISFLFLIQVAQGQSCGHRLIKKAKKYETKGNYWKAERKLRKCIYKNRVDNSNCPNCYTAYTDFLFNRGRLEEALNIVDEWLISYSQRSSIRCLKFDILNTLLELSISKNNYKEALIIVSQIESMDYRSSEDEYCTTKHRDWFNDKNETLYYKSNAYWSVYYMYKKIELLLSVNLEAVMSKDTTAINWAFNNIISFDLTSIGSEGEKVKNYALSELYKVYFAQKNYLIARTLAQTLETKGYEEAVNVKRVCKCDSILADLAYKSKDYALAIDYWEHYKQTCKSLDENFYNGLYIKQAKDLFRKSYSIDKLLLVIEYLNQIDCNRYPCNEVNQIRRDTYLEIAKIYEQKNQYSEAIRYLDNLVLEFSNDYSLKLKRRDLRLRIAEQYEKSKNYNDAIYYLDNLIFEFPTDSALRKYRRDIYLKVVLQYKLSNKYKDALDYLDKILIEFPNDIEALKLRGEINYKLGVELKNKGEYELAVRFLSNAESDFEFGAKSLMLIAEIYENVFAIDSAEKYVNKVISHFGSEKELKDKATSKKIGYQIVKGNLEKAITDLPDFCASNYKEVRDLAKSSPLYFNLRNDPYFNYWLKGNRRIVCSDFRIQTNYNQDNEDFWANKSEPEYYFEIINNELKEKYGNATKVNSSYTYDILWEQPFFIDTQYTNKFSYSLGYKIWEHDEIAEDIIGDVIRNLYYPCKVDEMSQGYVLYNHKGLIDTFFVSFRVKDSYDYTEKVVYPFHTPSLIQIGFEVAKCIFYRLIKPIPFLIWEIGRAILIDNKFTLDDKGVGAALLNYAESKLPSKIYNVILDGGFVTCMMEVLVKLQSAGWANTTF